MLAVEEITSVPAEQTLILELDEGMRPFYRDDLPQHNYGHPRDEVLPEVIRLDTIEPTTMQRGRLKQIAASLTHDADSFVPLDPDDWRTVEQRTMELVRPVLRTCGFKPNDIEDIDDLIESTGIGTVCKTKDQVKMRRGDLVNVGQKRSTFLAVTANIFCEKEILAEEYDKPPPHWASYIAAQALILNDLLSQDLSLGNERVSLGMGPFNRAAMKNIAVLMTKSTVSDPVRFIAKYGQFLRPLVSERVMQSISRAVA